MTKKLTNAEMLNDVLGGQKNLMKIYLDGIIESNCPKMRSKLAKILTQTTSNQYKIFEYLTTNNLYPIDNANMTNFNEAVSKFSQPLA